MFKHSVIECVPLNNGKPTAPVSAVDRKKQITLDDGSKITLQKIVNDKHTYDGQIVSIADKDNSDPNSFNVIVSDDNVYLTDANRNFHLNPHFGLGNLDLTKDPAALKKAISKTSHPMKSKMVAMTELSVMYGPSSSGKTLATLSDLRRSIQDGTIKGSDVVYVNLDDSAIGLAEKAEILADLGIKMIKEFDLMMLYSMIEEDVAKGKIIVIDTIKKIVDLMNKRDVTDLMKHFKNFTHAGGTAILVAHSNKHLGADGLPILEGVGDLRTDADCVVRVQRYNDIITMANDNKHRSYVEMEAVFQTAVTKDYGGLFHSIKQLSGQEAEDLKHRREQESYAEDNNRLIQTITDMLTPSPVFKTQLVKDLMEETGLNRKSVIDTLDLLEGGLWDVVKGINNSKSYALKTVNLSVQANNENISIEEYLTEEGYIPHRDEQIPLDQEVVLSGSW